LKTLKTNEMKNDDENTRLSSDCQERLVRPFVGNSEFLIGDKVSVHRPPIRNPEYFGVVVGVSPFRADWIKVKDDESGKTYGWHYDNVRLISRTNSQAQPQPAAAKGGEPEDPHKYCRRGGGNNFHCGCKYDAQNHESYYP